MKSEQIPAFSLKHLLSLLLPAILIWLVPLIASFFFYTPNGDLFVNFWVFKAAMIVISFATSFAVLPRYYRHHQAPWFASTIIIFGINILLDAGVLIGLFETSPSAYALEILPVYAILMPLTNFWFSRQLPRNA